ncbi:sigma-70 family RNA polymerase sigma factor [bacterium]|nr:sigma-70 family RNA polymerase sigma factor [bacterium]
MSADGSEPLPSSASELTGLVVGYVSGDAAAGERLFAIVGHHAAVTTRVFLGRDAADAPDIAQDTALAVLEYIRRRGGFDGNLVSFTVTVARNRCRNHLLWAGRRAASDVTEFADEVADDAHGPLALLEERERDALVRRALAALDDGCRRLLEALFREGRTAEEMRGEAGLKTVAGLYHRRAVCLARAGRLLSDLLFDCSSGGESRTDHDGNGDWRRKS